MKNLHKENKNFYLKPTAVEEILGTRRTAARARRERRKRALLQVRAALDIGEKGVFEKRARHSRRLHNQKRTRVRRQKQVERRRAEESRIAAEKLAAAVKQSAGTALPLAVPQAQESKLGEVVDRKPATTRVAARPQDAPRGNFEDWKKKPSSKCAEDDGLLLIIPVRVFGKQAQALVDSGATRSFVSPKGTVQLGLHCVMDDVVLELADGSKVLSKGKAPHVPVVAAGSTVKVDLTVTPLLQDVDLILGVNWLQAANPLIDWTGPRLQLDSPVGSMSITGKWVDSTVKVGTVTVLGAAADFSAPSLPAPPPLSVLGTPTFWDFPTSSLAWRRRSLRGDGSADAGDTKGKDDDSADKTIIQYPQDLKLETVPENSSLYTTSVKKIQGKVVRQRQSKLEKTRTVLKPRGFNKLAKEEGTIFLAMVRTCAAERALTGRELKEKMKKEGPKKRFLTVEEQEEEALKKVPAQHREKLKEIIDEFKDVFPEKLPPGRPPERSVEFEVKLEEGSKPPSRPPYRLGPAEQDEMEAQIKDLLAQGFIRPSASPFGAPVLFAPKKDGRWRMCFDYRALNKQTIKDRYPLPRIDELMEWLGQARVFTKLDLASGYHQIAVKEADIHKTAFRTNRGQYEFIVMPFGVTNAPSTFQRLMNNIFGGEINHFILVYLDDILVFSRTVEEHWQHLRIALQRLREAKLYGRIHKCDFLQNQTEYLGFDISSEGIKTSPGKVQTIAEWPQPSNVKDVRSFLGLASYYRRFVRGFSSIAKPLTDLTKDRIPWLWGEAQERAFQQLKVALMTAPILTLPDFEKPFVVTTDASLIAVGGILQQEQGNGLQPIAFASKKLTPTETRYSAYERELLGIVWAIGLWRHYLQGQRFVVQTDHSALKFLPNQASVHRRIWKWVSILQGYDVEIQHIPGAKNPSDALTRKHWVEDKRLNEAVKKQDANLVKILKLTEDAADADIQAALDELFVEKRHVAATTITRGVQPLHETAAKLLVTRSSISLDEGLKRNIRQKVQLEDPYKEVLEQLEDTSETTFRDLKFRIRHQDLVVHQAGQPEEGPYWRLVIPDAPEIRETLLKELHSVPYAGHPGYTRTLDKARKHFYWVGMARDVRRFIEECPVCQVEKADHTRSRGPLQPLQIPEEKWAEVMIDFIFKLPITALGHDGIMVVIDRATKMAHLIPCHETATASDVARIFWARVGSLHGIPRCIYSDRDVRFTGGFWRSLWSRLGTELRFSTAHHPQTQGLVERTNQTIEQVLRCLIHELGEVREWDQLLPTVEFILNSHANHSTGYSPFYLNWGYHPVTPQLFLRDRQAVTNETVNQFLTRMSDAFQRAKNNMRRASQRSKSLYDKRRREVTYTVGDWVLLSTENLFKQGTPQKLQRKFVGPYKIVARHGNVAYELELPATWRRHPTFHVSLLKPWRGQYDEVAADPEELEDARADLEDENEETWETERILRWRKTRRGNQMIRQYLVTLKEKPLDEAIWMDEDDFINPEELKAELERDSPTRDPSSL